MEKENKKNEQKQQAAAQKQGSDKSAEKEKKKPMQRAEALQDIMLIRILTTDIPGNKDVYSGLTFIRGISWAFSNALLKILGIDKRKKIQDLTEQEISAIGNFIKSPTLPTFLLNRRKDYHTGKDKHVYGADLNLQRDFDIKRLKKIKAYRGLRHAAGQPVRGQRTKSHFRKRNSSVGVKKGGAKRV